MRCTKHLFSWVIVCAAMLMTASSCQKDDLSSYNPILSATNEGDLGIALYEIVLNNSFVFPILDRNEYADVYDYVNGIMRMVEVKTNIRDKYEWEVLILEDDEMLNAFTLPGGKIIITTGFLKFMDSEHQLFSLIAHEAYYADRIDQNSQSELSLIMQKLKQSDKYSTMGTRIFLEVINGANDEEGIRMVEFAMEADYEPYEVLDADNFSLGMICDNYLYSARGIKEIILSVENNSDITVFEWFENKPPVPTTLINQGTSTAGPFIETRINEIDIWLNDCGSENSTQNIANYMDVIQTLP